MTCEIYVLSYNRPELLACTLGSVCGFNSGFPIHVIDDGSSDPRVHELLKRYRESMLIQSVESMPHGSPCPPGRIRRRAIDKFLAGKADNFIQIEADMLVGSGQVKLLADAYNDIRAEYPLHVLNVVWFQWVRPCLQMLRLRNYTVAITRGMSEPMWISNRNSLQLAVNAGMIPPDRPDLVLWVDRMNGATLIAPEPSVQHIGAGKASLLYDYFSWTNVVIRSGGDAGALRQPFPAHPLSWPDFEARMPQSALNLYEFLRATSPIPLPEMPK